MQTLLSFRVNRASLSSIYDKADQYAKFLYKYYTGDEVRNNKYWKDELRSYLKTNSRKSGRYVPGRGIKFDNKTSDDIINEMSEYIVNYLTAHPEQLINTAFKTLNNLELRLTEFNEVQGVQTLKNAIDDNPFFGLDERGSNGLKLELKKTLERYLGLKDDEVIINTNNYKSGSPIYDIQIKTPQGTIQSEVKTSLHNFRILGINSPFRTAPKFVSTITQDCMVDIEKKKIYLSKDSIAQASIELLKDHFSDYQPFFESDDAVALFTDFFLNDRQGNSYLPIEAKTDEDDDVSGEIETIELEGGDSKTEKRKVENYIKKKITRYMLWYSKAA